MRARRRARAAAAWSLHSARIASAQRPASRAGSTDSVARPSRGRPPMAEASTGSAGRHRLDHRVRAGLVPARGDDAEGGRAPGLGQLLGAQPAQEPDRRLQPAGERPQARAPPVRSRRSPAARRRARRPRSRCRRPFSAEPAAPRTARAAAARRAARPRTRRPAGSLRSTVGSRSGTPTSREPVRGERARHDEAVDRIQHPAAGEARARPRRRPPRAGCRGSAAARPAMCCARGSACRPRRRGNWVAIAHTSR